MELRAPAQASDQVLDLALDQDQAQAQAWDQALVLALGQAAALLGMVREAMAPTQAQVQLGLHTQRCFVSGRCMSCVCLHC